MHLNASVLPQFLSTHLSSSFNFRKVQIWPRTFPLCIVCTLLDKEIKSFYPHTSEHKLPQFYCEAWDNIVTSLTRMVYTIHRTNTAARPPDLCDRVMESLLCRYSLIPYSMFLPSVSCKNNF